MGFFSDYRSVTKQAKQLTPPEHRGVMGGFRAARDGMATANEALSHLHEYQAQAAAVQAGAWRIGSGTVLALRDTGVTINESPQVQMDLMVTAEGYAPFSVTAEQLVDRLAITRCQPGAQVQVRFDPNAPTQQLIVIP